MIYIITDYLTPLAYNIQTINISLGLVITLITLIFVTPKQRYIFRRNEQQIITNSIRTQQLTENLQHFSRINYLYFSKIKHNIFIKEDC